MATRDTVEEVLRFLRDNKPAEWDRFKGMSTDEYNRIVTNWTRTLEPIPGEILLQVTVTASRQAGSFLPSPGDLYDAALDSMDSQPDPDEAWALVWKRAQGYDVDLPERADKALKAIGGIPIGGWKLNDVPFRRKDFCSAYKQAEAIWKCQASLPGTKLLESGR